MIKPKKRKRTVTKPEKPPATIFTVTIFMTGDRFRASLEKLYSTPQCQSAFARLIDVSDRTVRAWISGLYPVPKVIAQLVSLMLKTKTKPEELKP